MSEQDVWLVLSALLTATPLDSAVYDYGKVPGESGNAGQLPTAFALLSIERRYVAPNRSGGTDRTGYRVSVRFVADTAFNARIVGGWVRDGLESTPGRGKRITVGGVESTPLTHESTTAVEKDEDRFSGLVTYTLAL
jgi:hypothetical protein